MADFEEDSVFTEGVRAFEATDPARFDVLNNTIKPLVDRTRYLYDNMGQGGGMSGLPVYRVSVAQGSSVPASQFEQEGLYILSSPTAGQYIKAYIDFSTIHPRAFISTFDAAGLFVTEEGEEYLVGNLTRGSYFSTSVEFTGNSAGAPVHDSGGFEVNQNLNIWNWVRPGEMFVLSDNIGEHSSYFVQIPSPSFGSVGMEYHFMSELDVPINFQYEDGSPISVAEGLSPKLRAAGSVVTLKKILPDKWVVFGDLDNSANPS